MEETHPEPELPRTPDWSEAGDDEDDGPIGVFPSWRALYWSVVVYAVALVILLHVFTVALNRSAP